MRNIDLTGKLGLEPKPTITIGESVLTVDDSTPTILRLMELMGDDSEKVTPSTLWEASKLLFDDGSFEALEGMDLSFNDFATVISAAMDLIMGGAEGEQGIPDTTS